MSTEPPPYDFLKNPRWLRGSAIAHRGLHQPDKGIIENSMSAFEAAIESGYGIECDVRLSADRRVMIFHDARLDRLTNASGVLDAKDAAALTKIPLKGSSDTIPLLDDLLDLTNRRVPLLIEIKSYDGDAPAGALEAAVAHAISGYGGPIAIQSFLPATVGWFRRHMPQMPRGFLSEDYRKSDELTALSGWRKFALRSLLAAVPADPTFIGYEVSALRTCPPRLARLLNIPVLAWTVTSQEEAKNALRTAHSIIFEGFRPPSQITGR